MNFNKELNELSNRLRNNDWFHDISFDKYNRVIVSVLWMNEKIINEVPSTLCGRQVLLYFAKVRAEEDHKCVSLADCQVDIMTPSTNKKPSLLDLTNKLDKLEKVCGTNTLGDIFFESHDGKNAVTNWSVKFPDVREEMDILLRQFGFDVIYEELEL